MAFLRKSKPKVDATPGREVTPSPKRRRPTQTWKQSERDAGKFLLEHDGPDPAMSKITSSTGRVGDVTRLQHDIASKSYKGEVKRDKGFFNAKLRRVWKQIAQIAEEHPGYEPVLILNDPETGEDSFMKRGNVRVRVPALHCITPARHAELLDAKKERDELLSQAQPCGTRATTAQPRRAIQAGQTASRGENPSTDADHRPGLQRDVPK